MVKTFHKILNEITTLDLHGPVYLDFYNYFLFELYHLSILMD